MLKNFLKKSIVVFIELAIVAGLLWYISEKKGIHNFAQIAPGIEQTLQNAKQKIIPFPELNQPITKKFAWEYKGKKYFLEKTLYGSVYEYYKNQPKEYFYSEKLPDNWKNEYYAKFIKSNPEDKTIEELSNQLQKMGKENGLKNDEMADFALSFVQAIPYDEIKAKNILNGSGNESISFSYEVLWEQSGVCSDKSFLAYALLGKLGYGVAIFEFEQEEHMAVGVMCPPNFSNYNSNYCYAETTSTGNKIGIIPNFDAQSGKAVEIKELSDYDPNQDQFGNLQELKQVEIVLPTTGIEYAGIIKTRQTIAEIERLKKEMAVLAATLKSQKNEIDSEIEKLEKMQSDLKKYEREDNVEKYNYTVEKYNKLVKQYKNDIKKYNNDIALYNESVKKYNALIKE